MTNLGFGPVWHEGRRRCVPDGLDAQCGGVRSPTNRHQPSDRDPAVDGRNVARGIVWMGALTGGRNLVSVAVFVILGRLLVPQQFGLVAAASLIITFFRVIIGSGFGRRLVQARDLSELDMDTSFWTALAMGAVCAGLTIAVAPLFAVLFAQPALTGVVRWLSLVFVFAAFDSTQNALLERQMRFRVQAIRGLAAMLASGAIAVGLAVAGAGVWALVGQQLALEGFAVALVWRLTDWRPSWRFSRSVFRDHLAFGARYSAIKTLFFLNENCDNFLIGVFLGPIALGYYVIAYRILTVLNEVLTLTIGNVAFPVFARLQDDRVATSAMLCRSTATTALVAFPAYAGLALVAHPLLVSLLGAKWAPSVPVLQLLTIAGVAQSQTVVTHNLVLARGMVSAELRWTSAVVAIQLIVFVAVVHLGIAAVAAALGAVLVLSWPIRMVFIRRWVGVRLRDYYSGLWPVGVATGVMAAAVAGSDFMLTGLGGFDRAAAGIVIGVAAYLVALSIVAPAEVQRLVSTLRGLVERRWPMSSKLVPQS